MEKKNFQRSQKTKNEKTKRIQNNENVGKIYKFQKNAGKTEEKNCREKFKNSKNVNWQGNFKIMKIFHRKCFLSQNKSLRFRSNVLKIGINKKQKRENC